MLAYGFLQRERRRRRTKAVWTRPRLRREIQGLLCTWAGVCCYGGAAQPRSP
jgi:hypothetical protein